MHIYSCLDLNVQPIQKPNPTGVHAVYVDMAAVSTELAQAPVQLVRKVNVRQLGAAVGKPPGSGVAEHAVGVDVLKIDVTPLVRHGSDVDYPRPPGSKASAHT